VRSGSDFAENYADFPIIEFPGGVSVNPITGHEGLERNRDIAVLFLLPSC